jgi:uncharacterized protein (TIGR00661 family)
MKILYAVQATGNGHISRAMELLPYLQHYGKVDIFLSGDNSNLAMDAPVKYRSKGLSLYYNCTGGLDYWQIMKAFQLSRLKKEIRELPVEKYDLVINDFEYITAAACAKKGIASVNFGHQASFQSTNTPRPEKRSMTGEWVLKNYARASRYIGLHFKSYDDFIFPPIIKKEILEADPTDKKYITVYLPSLCEQQLKDLLKPFMDCQFEVFCRETKQSFHFRNIHFLPVDKNRFNKSLIHCTGIITGAGFETPAEALHLEKKLLCIPIKGQYEQQCNAAALKEMGVACLKKISPDFEEQFIKWIESPQTVQVNYHKSVDQSLDYLFAGQEQSANKSALATPSGLLSFLL